MAEMVCVHLRNAKADVWYTTFKGERGNNLIEKRRCKLCGTEQTKVLGKNGQLDNPRTQAWIGVRQKTGYAGQSQADEL